MSITTQQYTTTQQAYHQQVPMTQSQALQQPIQQPTQVVIQQQPVMAQPMVVGIGIDDPTSLYIMAVIAIFLPILSLFGFCCIDPILPNQPKRNYAKNIYWICFFIGIVICVAISATRGF